MTTQRNADTVDRQGSQQEAATIITVGPGKPDQVAHLTNTFSTESVDVGLPAAAEPPLVESRSRQPGRALKPAVDVAALQRPASLIKTGSHVVAIQPALAATSAASEMTPQRLLNAFRRRWGWAVGLGLLAAAIVGPAAFFILPSAKFTAEADLRVLSRAPVVAFTTAETANQAGDDYRRYQKTQIALIKSANVLQNAIDKLRKKYLHIIREQLDPVQWLKDHLDVTFPSESEILQIALKGDDAREVTELVNAIADSYMQDVVYQEMNRRTQRYDKLKEVREKKIKELQERRKRVRELAESLGSNNQQAVVFKQQLDDENLHVLEKELLELRSKKRRSEAELTARLKLVETVAGQTPGAVDDVQVDAMLDEEPAIIALQQRLDDAEYAVRQHLSRLTKTARNPAADPAINELKLEARRARIELNDRRKALRPVVLRKSEVSGGGKGENTLSSLRRELEVLDDQEKRLVAERDQLASKARKVNTQNLELQAATDEIEQAQVATDKMQSEIQELEIELQAPGRVQLIDKAEVPVTSDALKRYMMVAMATLGALFATLFGMTFWELQSRKVSSSADVSGELGLPLLGTLPALPVRARRANPARFRSQDLLLERLMAESIDVTRTMLLNATEAQGGQVIAITSAMGGEGKTSLSCHLASSLARSGRKTLLIDADLRNPSLHRLFDQPVGPGLSELLRGDLSTDEAFVPTSLPGLDLIPAGEADAETMRSLSQGGLVPILAHLRDQYDCVIIDTAPVLPITDTLLIAPHTDGVILAVLTDVSRSPKVSEAHKRLTSIGASVLGAVFTGDRLSVYGKDYRYRYVRGVADRHSDE